MYIKDCIVCGNVYETSVKHQIYCGKDCREKQISINRKTPGEIKKEECENCNSLFLKKRVGAKFCSLKCFYQSIKKEREIKSCLVCGEKFDVIKGAVKKNKFCSAECAKKRIITKDIKLKISKANKGRILTEEHKEKIGKSHKGKKLEEWHRKRVSECAKKRLNDPEKHPNWKGGISSNKKEYARKFYQKNKEKYNKLRRQKREDNYLVKLRETVSRTIYRALKKQRREKNSKTWIALPYTPQELKEHLESLFEPWMTWDNHGRASIEEKTWQIDHIVPQSKLPYESLDDENFKKCWALENLRPLDAIENIKKGNEIIEDI